MRVLVDSIPMSGLVTGICRHMRSLYDEVEKLPGIDVHYYGRHRATPHMPPTAQAGKWIKTTSAVWKLPDPAVVLLRTVFWLNFERKLRAWCCREKYDIYHETAFVPADLPDLPVVFSLYDLSLIKYRHMHPRERVQFFDLFWKRRLGCARHFITSSEYTRTEALDVLGIPESKVTSIHLAHSPHFHPRDPRQVERVLAENGWPRDYLLFVGSLEPRKNLKTLVSALAACRSDVPLLLAGWEGWGDKGWMDDIRRLGLERRVIQAGYVDDETLACLYGGALAFVYPSLYEGFGLPVLEAMACGCPVLCSNASSIPEVAGDAAFLFDPENVEQLADGIDKVAGDQAWRRSLIEKGFARASRFHWSATAAGTVEVFRRVLAEV